VEAVASYKGYLHTKEGKIIFDPDMKPFLDHYKKLQDQKK